MEPTMLNQEPSSSVSSDEPSTQAPALKETVLKGTNSSVLTIHTNGTYDFVCSDYYLSTKDYPALKALLIMANDEQKNTLWKKTEPRRWDLSVFHLMPIHTLFPVEH